MPFAGSAIAQDARRLGNLDSWAPGCKDRSWLLLCGATDPPSEVQVSNRRPRNDRSGAFLFGVNLDIQNMEKSVGPSLYNTVKNLKMKKKEAMEHIKELFDECHKLKRIPMLYYTGHGEEGTGNWCFSDGTISAQEVLKLVKEGNAYGQSYPYPMIISDCCFSGHWANFCLEEAIEDFQCLAACPEYQTAIDVPDQGGEFTSYITGNNTGLPNLRPSREPVYSGGDRSNFPIPTDYNKVKYTSFIASHIRNSDDILIYQNLNKGKLNILFGSHKHYKPRPSLSWCGLFNDYDQLDKKIDDNWNSSPPKRLVSIVADEDLGFGGFFMAEFGNSQTVLRYSSTDSLKTAIKKYWDEDKMITSCAARGLTFFVVMTKNVKAFHGKVQSWSTASDWKGINDKIQEGYKDGKAITDICYNQGLKVYFLVMTKTPEGQDYKWFSDAKERKAWTAENYKNGYYPTILFQDVLDNKTLVVVTRDGNRSGYLLRTGFEIE